MLLFMGDSLMPPHMFTPSPWETYIAKVTLGCDYVKVLETERLSWMIQVSPKCNHKGPYGRESGGLGPEKVVW